MTAQIEGTDTESRSQNAAHEPSSNDRHAFRLPNQLIGRAGAVACVLGGFAMLLSPILPLGAQGDSLYMGATGVLVVLSGVVVWYLPWSRWPRWYTHFLVPLGFGIIAFFTVLSGLDPFIFGVFYCAVFVLIGMSHRRGTGLMALPLFALAYVPSMAVRLDDMAAALNSAVGVGLVCAAIAEMVAWLSKRLEESREALWRSHAAVNDMSASLTGVDPRRIAATAAAKLATIVDAPQVRLLRLRDGGRLACLANVVGGQPRACPGDARRALLSEPERRAVASRGPVTLPHLASGENASQQAERQHREAATVLVPLIARDDVIGVAEIDGVVGDQRAMRERTDTAVSVCRLIAMSIQDAEALQAEREQAGRLASLLESSRAVASAASVAEALAIVTRCAADVFAATECIAYEYDRQEETLVAKAAWGLEVVAEERLSELRLLAAHPAEQQALKSNDAVLQRLSDPDLDSVSRGDMQSWGGKTRLHIPMRSVGGPMGLLVLWDSVNDRGFDDDELALAFGLAELAGEAVRSARMLRELRLLSHTDSLTGLANHREIRDAMAREHARAVRHGKSYALVMLDVDGFKAFNDTFGHPAGDAVLRAVAAVLRAETRPTDIVGRNGGDEFVLVLPDTNLQEAEQLAWRLHQAMGGTAPVADEERRIPISASMGVAAFPGDAHSINELVAVADTRLYAAKRRGPTQVSQQRGESGPDVREIGAFEVLESLVVTVNSRDGYTQCHSDDVADYALALAESLGLSRESQRNLRLAGLLHDIGNIAIPARILCKPTRLAADELEIVKGHSALGDTIIASLPESEQVRAAVLAHHERYDGTGYPQGLVADDIPLLGRILAVADAFVAMTETRPYRPARTVAEAIAELRAGAGAQFDPALVEPFIRCVERRNAGEPAISLRAETDARADIADGDVG